MKVYLLWGYYGCEPGGELIDIFHEEAKAKEVMATMEKEDSIRSFHIEDRDVK